MSAIKIPRVQWSRTRWPRSVLLRAAALGIIQCLLVGVLLGFFWSGLYGKYAPLDALFLFCAFFVWWQVVPGPGLVAVIVGLYSSDRLVSFLTGLLPSILIFLVLVFPHIAASASNGQFIAASIARFWWNNPLWYPLVGIADGLLGLSGALYGAWRRNLIGTGRRTMRLVDLCWIVGIALWFSSTYLPYVPRLG